MSLPPPVTQSTMPPSKGMQLLENPPGFGPFQAATISRLTFWSHTETARHECVSPEALQHLKTYKYSSVDKSFISRYILKHYVRARPLALCDGNFGSDFCTVEWLRRTASVVDRAQSRHALRFLLHIGKCCIAGNIHTRPGWTGMHHSTSATTTHDMRLTEPQAPSWVYYSFAFGMWM